MEFGGNYCGYNWREISENPDKEHYSKSSITEFIEIYSYLIDESSLAMFGVKGANGIIIITTNRFN